MMAESTVTPPMPQELPLDPEKPLPYTWVASLEVWIVFRAVRL